MTMRGWDESFKRPGAIPFKWEIQPGVPKQAAAAADTSTAGHQKLQPPPARFVRSAPVSPAKSRPFPTRSPSPSPSRKLPAAVTSHGCFPAGAPLKRRDRKTTKAPQQAAAPTRRSPSAFSAPLGRAVVLAEGAPRRARAFTGPLSKSGSPSAAAAAEDAWARRASLRRSSSACFSPLDSRVPTAEEAVSASRWLF